MSIVKLNGVIKDYAWGNSDFIASLLSIKESGRRAELWMGTHSAGEATTESGERLSCVAGGRLPFLFKVLAIAEPLSLQCHPSKEMAEEGWNREREKRERGEDINYKDDNQKSEVLSALTPVTALCGFIESEAIRANLERIIPVSYDKYLKSFKSIRELFFRCFSLSSTEKEALLSELKVAIDSSSIGYFDGPFYTAEGIIRRCLEKYPGDIGALFPLMMNVVHLNEGEALYLKPGVLHAYVLGNGVELMDASDNVLRGGLTIKRIDQDELKRIMSFDSLKIEKVRTNINSEGLVTYAVPSDSYSLSYADSGTYHLDSGYKAILITMAGGVEINGAIKLKKGEIVYIGEDESPELKVEGRIYLARSRA